MTVKDLLEFIEKYNIPLDAEVRYQRIEDRYFDKWGWNKNVIKKEGFAFNEQKKLNDKVDSGVFDDKEQYPDIKNPELLKCSDEEMKSLKDQYIPSFCCVKYLDDNNLYIDAHY